MIAFPCPRRGAFHVPLMLTARVCMLAAGGSAIIGELDEEVDSQLDLAALRGEPLRPLIH